MTKQYKLTDEFKQALDILENTNESLFLTGNAGSGKSTLLNIFLETTQKSVAVLGSTGIAALNVKGVTVHKFFKLPPTYIKASMVKPTKDFANILSGIDTILIDEVSMLRSDVMDAISISLQKCGNPNLPFGGKQLVLVGDVYQLPPVVTPQDKDFFKERGPYFFNASCFDNYALKIFKLTKIFRQKDDSFKKILNRVRNNKAQTADLDILNKRWIGDNFKVTKEEIVLTAVNKTAAATNEIALNQLSSQLSTSIAEVKGKFDIKSCPAEEILKLKEGAQIMMVTNNPEGLWVNGTIGTIKAIHRTKRSITVILPTGDCDIYMEVFKQFEYSTSHLGKMIKKEIGSFTQFPMKLAWAITIHKSQGKTFDKVVIDLGYGAFAHGQTYVALSRCTSLEGIKLVKRINQKDIILNNEVIQFLNSNNYESLNN